MTKERSYSTEAADEFYNSLNRTVQTTLSEIAVNLYISQLAGWKELGRLLSFDCRDLEMFQLQSPPKGEIPALAMLKEWFRHPDCGFPILAGLLSEMRRSDCVALIIQCLEAKFQVQFAVESSINGDSYMINLPNALAAATLLEIGKRKSISQLHYDILMANVTWNTPVYKLSSNGVAFRLKSSDATSSVISDACYEEMTSTDVQTLERQATQLITSNLKETSFPGLYLVGRVTSADGPLFLFVTTLGGNILKIPINKQNGCFSLESHSYSAASIGKLIRYFQIHPLRYVSSSRAQRELLLSDPISLSNK